MIIPAIFGVFVVVIVLFFISAQIKALFWAALIFGSIYVYFKHFKSSNKSNVNVNKIPSDWSDVKDIGKKVSQKIKKTKNTSDRFKKELD